MMMKCADPKSVLPQSERVQENPFGAQYNAGPVYYGILFSRKNSLLCNITLILKCLLNSFRLYMCQYIFVVRMHGHSIVHKILSHFRSHIFQNFAY